jgi:hypothetical protein
MTGNAGGGTNTENKPAQPQQPAPRFRSLNYHG